MNRNATKQKSTEVELLLCVFLGVFGAHRFYTKKYGTAVLYLFTMGVFYIGWLVDIVQIVIRLFNERKTQQPSIQYSSAVPTSSNEPALLAMDNVQDVPVAEVDTPSPVAYDPGKVYHVTGVQHYTDNLIDLATENPNYSMSKRELVDAFMTEERIWKYEFYISKAELVPEPENPHDPNAIKVVADGQHIGYIKSGSCKHLLKVIREGRIESVDCTIGGGPYKYIEEDYDYEREKDVYNMDHGEKPYSVTLHIREA